MPGIITESVAYYFPTRDSLAQFIKKYGEEIVNSKGMGRTMGLPVATHTPFAVQKTIT